MMKGKRLKDILSTNKFIIFGLALTVIALSGCVEPDLRVDKTVDHRTAELGTELKYEYNISNFNQTYKATDITLVDSRFGQISLPSTELEPMKHMIVPYNHIVNATDMATLLEGVLINNTAYVNGLIDGKPIPDSPDTDSAFVVAVPLEIINKAASTKTVKLGEEITYQITLHNPTNTLNANNVVVKDIFDGPVEFVYSDPAPYEGTNVWNITNIPPKGSQTITLVIKPQGQLSPSVLNNIASIYSIDGTVIEEALKDYYPEILPYFSAHESVMVGSVEYRSMDSFEELLRSQTKLWGSFEEVVKQTKQSEGDRIELLYSAEDLLRRQSKGVDLFSTWIDQNWDKLSKDEKMLITDSFEDLLRRQAKNLTTFGGDLNAWIRTFDPVYQQKFMDSFEDLLKREAALLMKFGYLLHKDGMQTFSFVQSFEDLLRRQADLIYQFGNLKEVNPEDKLVIFKSTDKNWVACGELVNFTFSVFNVGSEPITGVIITDPSALPVPIEVGTLNPSEVRTYTNGKIYECEDAEGTYPEMICNIATAKGTIEATEIVAKSNEVCIILSIEKKTPQDILTLTKSADVEEAYPGETIVYSYSLTNNYDLPVTDISIEDDLIGLVVSGQTLQPGESATFKKGYQVPLVNPQSPITNQAIATGTTVMPVAKAINGALTVQQTVTAISNRVTIPIMTSCFNGYPTTVWGTIRKGTECYHLDVAQDITLVTKYILRGPPEIIDKYLTRDEMNPIWVAVSGCLNDYTVPKPECDGIKFNGTMDTLKVRKALTVEKAANLTVGIAGDPVLYTFFVTNSWNKEIKFALYDDPDTGVPVQVDNYVNQLIEPGDVNTYINVSQVGPKQPFCDKASIQGAETANPGGRQFSDISNIWCISQQA